MLSVLIYGRNDAYGGTAQRRSALSINAIAEVLGKDDEIIFVDYNTEDHKLTFPETIADTLTPRAQGLVKVVRVRPRHHEQLTLPGALPVVESVARNIGLRHTNRANRWVLSTNPDIVLVPPAEGLRVLLDGLEDGYYAAPRFELPRMLWQRLPRHDPAAARAAIDRFAAALHLDEQVRHYIPALGFDAPGDFQLVLRQDLMEMGGFDEAMQQAWHVDANLMARLGLKYGTPRSLAGRLRIYHCEHTADTLAKHSAGRSEDSFERFVTKVSAGIANAGRQWGGAGLDFEDLELFARAVMPEFKEQEEARQRKKDAELAPYIEAALARKERMPALADERIPTYEAYGYSIAEIDLSKLPEAQRLRAERMREMREIVERFDAREADPASTR